MFFFSQIQGLALRRWSRARPYLCSFTVGMGFRAISFLLLFILFFSSPAFSEFHWSPAKKRARESSATKLPIPSGACSEADLETFTGKQGLEKKYEVGPELRLGQGRSRDLGIQRFEGRIPSYPLFIQKEKLDPNPDFSKAASALSDSMSLAEATEWPDKAPPAFIQKYSNVLHPDIQKNFTALFSHAIACLENNKPEFIESLRELIQSSIYNDEDPSNYSEFFGKVFNANTRKEEDNPDFDPSLVMTLKQLIERLQSVETIAQKEKEDWNSSGEESVLPALRKYLSTNASPTGLQDLVNHIDRVPHKNTPREASQVSTLNALVAGAIGQGAASAFFDQRDLLGSNPRVFTEEANPNANPNGRLEPQRVLLGVSNKLKSFGPAWEEVQAQLKAGAGRLSVVEAGEMWAQFESRLEKELKTLSPRKLVVLREEILSGLKTVDGLSTPDSQVDLLQLALQREALMRAGHALESVIPDPAAALLNPRDGLNRNAYGGYTKALKDHARSLNEPSAQKAHALLKEAQEQLLGLAIPMASMESIRKTDPFLFELLKDQNGKLQPESRAFFESGFSSHLFNPTKNGNTLAEGLQRTLESSSALESFSEKEKTRLRDLLKTAKGNLFDPGQPFRGTLGEWREAYESTREKLLKELEQELSKNSRSERAKALAFTIEMLDSTGNHSVNAYAPTFQGAYRDHYQTDEVLDRFQDELRMRKESTLDPAANLHGLIQGAQGIPSRARIAEMTRAQNPDSKKEEVELLPIYRDLLTQGGKRPLSKEGEEALKKLVFENQTPETLLNQMEALVPGFSLLQRLRGVREGVLPPGLLSQGEKVYSSRKAVIEAELRAFESLRNAIHKTSNRDHLQLLEILSKYLEPNPGLLGQMIQLPKGSEQRGFSEYLLGELAPLIEASSDLKQALSDLGAKQSEFSSQVEAGLRLGEGSPIPSIEEYLFPTGSGVRALGALQARLGKDHPVVKKYQEELAGKFSWGSQNSELFAKNLHRAATQESAELKSFQEKRKKHAPLFWDDSIDSFVITDKSKFKLEDLAVLEREFPKAKFVWRDSRTPGKEEVLGLYELKNRIFHTDQELALEGLSPLNGEWFPVPGSSEMAGRYINENGERVFQLGSLPELRKRMLQAIQRASETRKAADQAVGIMGQFGHSFRDVLFNPGGLGFVFGFDPNQSPEDELHQRARQDFTKARSQLKEFGLLGASGLHEGRNLLEDLNNHENRLSQNTQAAIQGYMDNVDLTGELGLVAATLPLAFLSGPALAASKAPQAARLAYLLAAGRSGGLLHLSKAARVAGAFAGASAGLTAISDPKTALLGDSKMREIQEAVEKGKEWRKFPEEPSPNDPKYQGNRKLFEQDWSAWQQESLWDRNGNGKADFTEDHLKDFAYRGEHSWFNNFVRNPTHTYKGMYGIALAGSLAPGAGFVPHMAIPTGLEQGLHILLGAGKPGDFTQRMTAWDGLQNTGVGVASAAPAMLAPGGIMRMLPARFAQELPKTLFGISNTRHLVGIAGGVGAATAASAATYAAYGGDPWQALRTEELLMHGYIGHGVTRSASVLAAREAILALKPKAGQPGEVANPRKSSSRSAWEALVKEHGEGAVDAALEQLRFESLDTSTNSEIYRHLSEYQRLRASQLGSQASTSLAENPFRETPLAEIEARASSILSEISGRRGLDLLLQNPSEFMKIRTELQLAKAALALKKKAAGFEAGARDSETLHALEQYRADKLSRQRSPQEWVEFVEEAPSSIQPFLQKFSDVSQGNRSSTPRWLERARALSRQNTFAGDLMRSFVSPQSGLTTPQERAQRASVLMAQVELGHLPRATEGASTPNYRRQIIREFVLSTTNQPHIQEGMAERLPLGTSREVLQNFQVRLGDSAATRFEKYLENPQLDPSRTLGEHFMDFISIHFSGTQGAPRLPAGSSP